MRGLTVRNPWAWAIKVGAKTVENRTWPTRYRGPVLLHVARALSLQGARDPRIAQLAGLLEADEDDILGDLGMVVARTSIVDCHPDGGCCRPWGESSFVDADGRVRRVVHHWVLGDVEVLDFPVAAQGSLGLWHVAPEVASIAGHAPAYPPTEGQRDRRQRGAR